MMYLSCHDKSSTLHMHDLHLCINGKILLDEISERRQTQHNSTVWENKLMLHSLNMTRSIQFVDRVFWFESTSSPLLRGRNEQSYIHLHNCNLVIFCAAKLFWDPELYHRVNMAKSDSHMWLRVFIWLWPPLLKPGTVIMRCLGEFFWSCILCQIWYYTIKSYTSGLQIGAYICFFMVEDFTVCIVFFELYPR